MYFSYDSTFGNFPKLKEVRIMVKSFTDAKFRLRFFNADDKQSPTDDLIFEEILIESKKKESFIKINVEKYNIYMPKQGLFIGIEFLMVRENRITNKHDSQDIQLFSPFLKYIDTPISDYSYFILSRGKWLKVNKKAPTPFLKKKEYSSIPAISCILK